ncbi:DUF3482 domain-containing protein [Antrihabitans cavernicola]|nr:DUF3482 domain-containing protein [Spelaeibacter cavernicola]
MTATALAAVSVATLGGAVAHAQPAPAAVAPDLRGTIDQITYHVATSTDHRSVVTDLTAGRFQLVDNGNIVTIADNSGKVVAALPMLIHLGDKQVPISAKVEQDGQRLTLAPVHSVASPLHDVSNQEKFFAETQKAMPQILTGAAIGAAIGFVLGFPLSLFILDFIVVPITTVVGAVVGAFAGLYSVGGDDAINSARDYILNPNG